MRIAPALLMLLPLAACTEPAPPVEPYPFVGSWDCGVAVFSFTNTTYNNGSETYRILAVDQDTDSYTLFIEGGYRIGLALVTDTGLTWVSGTTGDQFDCARVN